MDCGNYIYEIAFVWWLRVTKFIVNLKLLKGGNCSLVWQVVQQVKFIPFKLVTDKTSAIQTSWVKYNSKFLCDMVHVISLTPINTVYLEWDVKAIVAIDRNRHYKVLRRIKWISEHCALHIKSVLVPL